MVLLIGRPEHCRINRLCLHLELRRQVSLPIVSGTNPVATLQLCGHHLSVLSTCALGLQSWGPLFHFRPKLLQLTGQRPLASNITSTDTYGPVTSSLLEVLEDLSQPLRMACVISSSISLKTSQAQETEPAGCSVYNRSLVILFRRPMLLIYCSG